MRALVKLDSGPGHVELRTDWPEPEPSPGWVKVRVVGSGVCGTDLHILEGTHKNWPPVVLGHEYAGEIVAVSADVDEWVVGDRIVCEQHTGACGVCETCRKGAIHLCQAKRSPGWGIDGAFADFMTLPTSLLHKIPDSVSYRKAIMTEPTAICLTGLDRVGLRVGESVAVIGPGPIGLISALLAFHSGASRVSLFGRTSSKGRLQIAREMGIDSHDVAVIAEMNGQFDVVIDSTGAAMSESIELSKTMGRVVQMGIASKPMVDFPLNSAMYKALTISFAMSSEYSTWDRALRFLAKGTFDPSPLLTPFDLTQWKLAFEAVEKRSVIKAALLPGNFSELDLS